MSGQEFSSGREPSDDDLIAYLRLLMEKGIIRSAADAILAIERENNKRFADRLRKSDCRLPLRVVLDMAWVEAEAQGYYREDEIKKKYRDRSVALIWPMPPHYVDEIFNMSKILILNPMDYPIPHHLHSRHLELKQQRRECRKVITQVDALVFEAYFEAFRDKGIWQVEDGVDELLDDAPEGLQLIVHPRPHDNRNDVKLSISPERLIFLSRRRHP